MGQLDHFESWRFGSVYFAVESASVKIGVRRHEHVYPHTAGAAVEKMGRKLYTIHLQGKFDDGLATVEKYSNHLNQAGIMRTLVETETTDTLVIPWIGKVQAQCEEFELTEKNTNRSGLGFSASFVEDLDFDFPLQNFVKLSRLPITGAAKTFDAQPWKADIFSKIAAAVGFILGIKDQFEMYTALVQSKLGYLEMLFREADATAKELSDPANASGLAAFMLLWETMRNFGKDIADKGLEFKYYTVPILMTVQQLAAAIYGDATKAGDLLGLNVIEDSTAIPAGTKIRYYEKV